MELQANTKVEYRFRLNCKSRGVLHVGSGQPGPMTDADLRRDSQGQIVIPGTAIAGAVRRAIERIASVDQGENRCQLYRGDVGTSPCSCSVCAFMGQVSPGTGIQAERKPAPSKVTFFDVRIGNPKTRVVDSVGIHRQRRSASDARKFDYAEVLPGARVDIEVRAQALTDREFKWLGAALRLLATGKIRIGGRTNRGHGELETDDDACKVFKRDLADVDQLLRSITCSSDEDGAWQEHVTGLKSFPNIKQPDAVRLRFAIATDDRSSLLIADPVAAARSGFDKNMRRLRDAPELPVPSLIGALRSGAERIVRTMATSISLERGEIEERVCDLFADDRCQPPADKHDRPVVENDRWCCLVCRVFGNQDWASRLTAVVHPPDDATFDELPFDHVAIDRFTGGASDHKKFDAMAVRNASFDVTLTLDVAHDADCRWKIGLLALVLRDLNDGRITLGHGSSKGHGLVRVKNLHWLPVPRRWQSYVADLEGSVAALWEKIRNPNPKIEPMEKSADD